MTCIASEALHFVAGCEAAQHCSRGCCTVTAPIEYHSLGHAPPPPHADGPLNASTPSTTPPNHHPRLRCLSTARSLLPTPPPSPPPSISTHILIPHHPSTPPHSLSPHNPMRTPHALHTRHTTHRTPHTHTQSPDPDKPATGLDVSEFVQNGIPMKMVTASNGAKIFLRPGTDVTAPTTGMWRHTYKKSAPKAPKVAPSEEEVVEEDEYGLPIKKKRAPKTALGDEVFQRPMWQVHSLWSAGRGPSAGGPPDVAGTASGTGVAQAPGTVPPTPAASGPRTRGGRPGTPGQGAGKGSQAGATSATASASSASIASAPGGATGHSGVAGGGSSGDLGGAKPGTPGGVTDTGGPQPKSKSGRQRVEQANGTLAVARNAPRAKLSLFAA